MRESTFYNKLKPRFPLKSSVMRIENKVARSTPDFHYTAYGFSCWIELKVLNKCNIKKGFIEVPWRPGQMGVARNEIDCGGHYFLLMLARYIHHTLLYVVYNVAEEKYPEELMKKKHLYKMSKFTHHLLIDIKEGAQDTPLNGEIYGIKP